MHHGYMHHGYTHHGYMNHGYMHHGHLHHGHIGRSQGGPKGRRLEVGAQRAPKLLVLIYWNAIKIHLG